MNLDAAITSTAEHLLALRHPEGHWEGQLSSSALSTATAIVALHLVSAQEHASYVSAGAAWLATHQNADGGWGDTTLSRSNLSTTLLCWSALHLVSGCSSAQDKATAWIAAAVGSSDPEQIVKAVVGRYGKDKTFSVPILMLCAICGRLGEQPWRRVLALPFELAALPRSWFGAVGMPVVSYALPALIAIGFARFYHAAPAWWNPLRWLRAWAWPKVSPMLYRLQPSSGGYLEATPLTSFVTMALASAGLAQHDCVPGAVSFLRASMREDGAWPIDTNLSTWGTTLAIKALCAPGSVGVPDAHKLKHWLLQQQYTSVHPFTAAAPGGWAWTPLPGGVPDADDTSGALLALKAMDCANDNAIQAGCQWLLDLQNRDGGVPTFCRGWGTLPFDRSTAEITTHALRAWHAWGTEHSAAKTAALRYLDQSQTPEGAWEPLWFGNEHAAGDANLVYGTAQVLIGLTEIGEAERIAKPLRYLLSQQHEDGSFGGTHAQTASIEETAVSLEAISRAVVTGLIRIEELHSAIHLAAERLLAMTEEGQSFPPKPIGLYFARLWYHEKLYPVIWTLGALAWAKTALAKHPSSLEYSWNS
jgi:squalene-hopene/tetraprenyl-beta-curcumene cyclase